ncbi:hypothetical protein HKD37_12G034099 [Glycine soja]
MSQKNDDLRLIHRWIIVKFKHQVCNSIPSILTVVNFEKNLGAERNNLHILAFSFPTETQNYFGKNTIPDSLTVGL